MGVGTFDIYKQISPNDFEIAFTSVALVLGHNNVPGAYNALKANSAFAFTEVAGSCYALTWYNNW